MKFLQNSLLVSVLTSSTCTAFTIAPRNGAAVVCRPSQFVATRQLQVALSDQDVMADADEDDMSPLTTEDVVAAMGENEGEELSLPSPPMEEHKIYVGNLPFSATVDKVRELFELADVPVLSVSLPTNPNRINEETGMPSSKGFAFVTVESEDLIEKGIEALNEKDFGGRAMRVNKLLPKEELERAPRRSREIPEGRKKLYIGNLSFDAEYDDLKDFFSEYGEIYDLYLPMKDGEKRGFGFVTMDTDGAEAALLATNGVEFMGRSLVVNEPLGKNEKVQQVRQKQNRQFKIYVGNLSFSTDRETLQGVFEEFGNVYDCYVPLDPNTMNPRGFAFVTMDRENGEDAIAELDGLELDGRFIRVNEAQGKRSPAPSYNNNRDDDWYNNDNETD
ncbi:RRM domain containing RNA-binding protein [Nitzschia inconspicua]|uniref:RRM domain containing RNA-binding protein n=1 Tax=Nitzschia inconspicua TaxID=303405 RepID=A0A9K3PLF5_9STRA|nr:RRM domain containing RNA-binding protein [Nitzschia inconspicua]